MAKEPISDELDLDDFDVDVVVDDATIAEPAPEPVAAPKPKPVKAKAKPKTAKTASDTTRIILEDNEDIPPTGLFVSINGRGYMIATSKEVDVPNAVIEVLKNARKSTPVIDPESRQVVAYRHKYRFPFQYVSA